MALGAAWFGVSAAMLFKLPEARRTRSTRPYLPLRSLTQILRSPALRAALAVTVVANVLVWPIPDAFLPVFADKVLQAGLSGLAWLTTAFAAGLAGGALVASQRAMARRQGWNLLGGGAALALRVVVLAPSPWLALSVLAAAAAGVAGALFIVAQETIVLIETPSELRGQAAGWLYMALGAIPIGMALHGVLAERYSVTTTAAFAGLAFALITMAVAVAAPRLLASRALELQRPRCEHKR